MVTMQLSGILFDMDGVLIDSSSSWLEAFNHALDTYGHEAVSMEEFMDTYWGDDLRDILTRLGLDVGIADFCTNVYPEHLGSVRIMPDTKRVLKELSDYPKAIVTNTAYDCTAHILEEFGIGDAFDTIMTADRAGKGKPAPDILFAACDELGISSDEVVLVGDTNVDVRAGSTAKIPVIGVGVKADITISSIGELPAIIASIASSKLL
ncbi:HAD family hydrolase [archaeon]|nr:MAG: HAD family hydrolase [archaeon]